MLAPTHPRCVYSMHDRNQLLRASQRIPGQLDISLQAGQTRNRGLGVQRHEAGKAISALLNAARHASIGPRSTPCQVDNWSPHGCLDGSSSRNRSI